jgi:hypothetical protein
MTRFLALLLFVGCACKPVQRIITICRIDQEIADCAKGDKNFVLQFPKEMRQFYAFQEDSMILLGDRLEECEVKGSLPRNDTTWEDMQTCEIGLQDCNGLDFSLMSGFFAVDSKSRQKILDRLEFCKR